MTYTLIYRWHEEGDDYCSLWVDHKVGYDRGIPGLSAYASSSFQDLLEATYEVACQIHRKGDARPKDILVYCNLFDEMDRVFPDQEEEGTNGLYTYFHSFLNLEWWNPKPDRMGESNFEQWERNLALLGSQQ